MSPLGQDLLSKSYFAENRSSPNQVYLGIQTLPAYQYASFWQLGFIRNLPEQNTAIACYHSGIRIGPYWETGFSLLLKKGFGKAIDVWMRPQWTAYGVRAYGNQKRLGAALGFRYRMRAWSMAALLRKSDFARNGLSELLFACRYRLSDEYAVQFQLQNQGRQSFTYGLELTYSKESSRLLMLGFGNSMHAYLRYQYQKKRQTFLFSIHYAPVLGFYPENAYGYAW